MKKLSIFAIALSMTMFVACSGESSKDAGHEEDQSTVIPESAGDELDNEVEEELTLEEDVFGADTDM